MLEQVFLIIGEVFVDTHLDIIDKNGPLVRLGGIFHSARAFASLDLNYALAYYAPNYLDDDINEWSLYLNTKGCYKLGDINRAPNIMLISESKESGDQGYYNIIKDQAEYIELGNIMGIINKVKPTDILIFPGRYNTAKIIKELHSFKGKIHIDFHYDIDNLVDSLDKDIESIILSTSAPFYKNLCNGTVEGLSDYFKKQKIHQFLVKENRGGSFCFLPEENKIYETASYYVPTMHSVGVGDVFNSIFISTICEANLGKRMRLAALCAAKYAETMSYEKFKANVQLVLSHLNEFVELKGIRLPWIERKNINIYIAAPDFNSVNTDLLDELNESLLYHNFSPRLPIRENGLVYETTSYKDEFAIYCKDIALLEECDLLIAVLLYNDPGTLVELGMFKQSGKPTIIYDPFNNCKNMFVRHTPDYLCKNIADVISSVYLCMGKGVN
ncbi:MAG: nucleoside 2-deoxyribosyltransferase [Gudongella sp.]|jgi:nucleoside 2-deoxyribosyltransferase|nr:nucleoside 2-deoxyribosyltransferase [Gudongella sp.]